MSTSTPNITPLRTSLVGSLLSALAPSWRLFDDVGLVPALWVRTFDGPAPDDDAGWRPACATASARDDPTTSPRRPWHLFLDGRTTLRVHAASCVDRLARLAQEHGPDDVLASVDHALVLAIARNDVRTCEAQPRGSLQFDLRVPSAHDDGVLLRSGPHPLHDGPR